MQTLQNVHDLKISTSEPTSVFKHQALECANYLLCIGYRVSKPAKIQDITYWYTNTAGEEIDVTVFNKPVVHEVDAYEFEPVYLNAGAGPIKLVIHSLTENAVFISASLIKI